MLRVNPKQLKAMTRKTMKRVLSTIAHCLADLDEEDPNARPAYTLNEIVWVLIVTGLLVFKPTEGLVPASKHRRRYLPRSRNNRVRL